MRCGCLAEYMSPKPEGRFYDLLGYKNEAGGAMMKKELKRIKLRVCSGGRSGFLLRQPLMVGAPGPFDRSTPGSEALQTNPQSPFCIMTNTSKISHYENYEYYSKMVRGSFISVYLS
jgi:hypothetical protein